MTVLSFEKMQKDSRAMSVARALALANERAVDMGWGPAASLVTITEEPDPTRCLWKIHFGPRDYINRRGGDMVMLVDEGAGEVRQVLKGQ